MTRTGIAIRGLELDDLRKVFLLGNELFQKDNAFTRPWDEKTLAGVLASDRELSSVAVAGKELAGFLIGAVHGRDADNRLAEIIWLGVQRRHIQELAPALLESFITRCAERMIEKIRFQVFASDPELIEICRKFNFTQIEHLLIMESFLSKK
ncbi:MAG: hypothetical protein A2W19_13035 [Spirochaetes bacterium RBG_16_49_21]|nr:MAG: hypothetical protein A2W19_13035 [Spirochaetes bacterium RBG_16_49_21]